MKLPGTIKKILSHIAVFFVSAISIAQKDFKEDKALLRTISKNFVDAAGQYKVLMKKLPPGRFPKTYDARAGGLETSGSEWW